MAESLYEKALRMLGRPIKKSDDPDGDPRVKPEAEPDEKKLEGAGEEAAAGGQAGGEGGVPSDPGAEGGEAAGAGDGDGDEGAGPGEGDGDGDEGLGEDAEGDDMTPDEVRELRKAFGLTDHDDIADTKKGKDISGLLAQILSYVQKVDAYQSHLSAELADLKAAHASGKADSDLRVTMKAVEEKVDGLSKLLENLPRTAPAAAQPKAFAKAVDTGAPKQEQLTTTDLTGLAMTGKLTAIEVARLNRQINHNPPAFAGN